MTCVDTNVVIDILDRDPRWFDWSLRRLADAAAEGAQVSAIVVAELSRSFDTVSQVLETLQRMSLMVQPLDEASAFVAGKRFQEFRQARAAGEFARVLPDFLIGAHAVVGRVPLLTRDPRLYSRYFPDLTLITPETHP